MNREYAIDREEHLRAADHETDDRDTPDMADCVVTDDEYREYMAGRRWR